MNQLRIEYFISILSPVCSPPGIQNYYTLHPMYLMYFYF